MQEDGKSNFFFLDTQNEITRYREFFKSKS